MLGVEEVHSAIFLTPLSFLEAQLNTEALFVRRRKRFVP